MLRIICLFILVVLSTVSTKIASGQKRNKNVNNQFLPVQIVYYGLPIHDSLKSYIKTYFQINNVEIVSKDEARTLIKNEASRAASTITSQDNFFTEFNRNIQPAYNLLEFRFKTSEDSSKVLMGWNVLPCPEKQGHKVESGWRFLKTLPLSNSIPQASLKALCDSIIFSNTLYK